MPWITIAGTCKYKNKCGKQLNDIQINSTKHVHCTSLMLMTATKPIPSLSLLSLTQSLAQEQYLHMNKRQQLNHESQNENQII